MLKLVTAVVVLSLHMAAAAADPPGETPLTTPSPAPSSPRDPGTAVMLSVVGTLASTVVTAAGLKMAIDDTSGNGAGAALFFGGLASSLVTPSLGEFYAGRYVTVGMGIRAASAVVVIGSLVASASESCSASCNNTMTILGITGLIGFATGVAWDIGTAGSAANAYNQRHTFTLAVTPTVLSPPSGPVMGVGLGGSF